MGEILAVGITHYPPLAGRDQSMAFILKRMLENPHLPEKWRHPENWPEPMRKEWSTDEGAAAAGLHRERLLQALRKTRAQIDEFRPDFMVVWGDDQYENFHEDVVPPYCIYAHDSFEFGPGPIPNNIWNEPPDRKFHARGNVGAAKYLATGLIEAGFDVAYSYKPLHHPLGHAFANAVLYLDYDRKGFPHPIIPFAINCYGRKVIAQRGGFPIFDHPPTEAQLDPPAPRLGGCLISALPPRASLLRVRGASPCWHHLDGRTRFSPRRTSTSTRTRPPTASCMRHCARATTRPGATIRRPRSRRAASRKSSTGCASRGHWRN